MGYDCGFDVYPRLQATLSNKKIYQQFLDDVTAVYKDVYDEAGRRPDGKIFESLKNSTMGDTTHIRFMIGECPEIPSDPNHCYFFIRFSSKFSGKLTEQAALYFENVYKIARKHFGQRIQYWHEICETNDERQWGWYDWEEVYDAERYLKQLIQTSNDCSGSTPVPEFSNLQIESSSDLYEIRHVAGKGLGMIALATIPAGTRIVAEKPLLLAASTGNSKSQKKRTRKLVFNAISELSNVDQNIFFALYNAFEKEHGPHYGIFRTNSLPLGPDATDAGVFVNVSRINHSCSPNSHCSWNENLQRMTVHSAKGIAAGEEITISYLREFNCYSIRQQQLKKNFGFGCSSCSLCSLSPSERSNNDATFAEMRQLHTSIFSGTTSYSNDASKLKDLRTLLQIYQKEDYTTQNIPDTYFHAFKMFVRNGDLARASVCAKRAAARLLPLQGADSPLVQMYEKLSKFPTRNPDWQSMGRWKTDQNKVPENKPEDYVENWLWQRIDDSIYADLRCQADFPLFEALPIDNDLDMNYYVSSNGFNFSPRKHWCLLAEVVGIEKFIRLRLIVKDRAGDTLVIAFHTHLRGGELPLSLLQTGFTVAILYAEKHWFMDMTVGIRHEEPCTLEILPVSLNRLLEISDKVQQFSGVRDGMRTCHACGKIAANLLKCVQCGLFWYCDKICQMAAWGEKKHKLDCKMLKNHDVRQLFLTQWDTFHEHLQFPLGCGGRLP